MISVNITFFKYTPYVNKETSKSISLEPKDDFILLIVNPSSSSVNVNSMPHRYGQVYNVRAQSTTDVPVVSVCPITDTISGLNVVIPSLLLILILLLMLILNLILIFLLINVKEKELHITYAT